jgi:hypothetical protein
MARTEEEVKIIVSARNDASKALNDVERDMGSLAKKAGGLGSVLGTAIGTFTGGAVLDLAAKGFSALTGVVTDGITGAIDAAKGYAQLDAVLASTGGTVGLTAEELGTLASDLSQAEGVSTFADDQILAMENLLLTFTNVRGDIFKEATQIGLDMATALGTDPAQQAIALGKALNDPVKGIAALTRVGVTFTDAQKDQITAMAEAGDLAGAQAVILDELAKEFGGSAKAAAEAAGPWAQISEMFGEFAEEIGTLVLPLIAKVGRALLGGPLQQAFKAILPLISIVVDSFITLGQALTGNWEDAAEGIHPLHRLIGNIGLAVRGIFDAFETGGLEGAIAEILRLLETAYPLIVETLSGWAGAFLDWIGPMIPPFLVRLGGILEQILTWIGEQVPSIAAKLLEWAIAFSQWIGERVPIIMEELGKLLDGMLNWMRDNKEEINAKLTLWAKAFGDWIMTDAWPYMLEELAKLLADLALWIIQEAPGIAADAIIWGTNMVTGILDGITGGWWRVAAKIAELMKETLSGGLYGQFFGGGSSSGQGAGSGPFAAPMGLATAGVVSGIPVTPSFSMVPRRPIGDVPNRGVIVGGAVVINVDARGARDPVEVERAGYRGARRALEEAARQRVGRRSVQRLRQALDRRARIR